MYIYICIYIYIYTYICTRVRDFRPVKLGKGKQARPCTQTGRIGLAIMVSAVSSNDGC